MKIHFEVFTNYKNFFSNMKGGGEGGGCELPSDYKIKFLEKTDCTEPYLLDKHWSFMAGKPFFLLSLSFSLCLSLSLSRDLRKKYLI